ncbi:hypothetical protein KAH55_06685 [bacterium]|nr:hypothetical protein [bacterium]
MLKKYSVLFLVLILLAGAGIGTAKEFPGTGTICAGDFWESFQPSAVRNAQVTDWTSGSLLFYIGNFDRQWTTPTAYYPAGERWSLVWSQVMYMVEYDPTGPFTDITAKTGVERDSYFSHAFHMPMMANAGGVTSNTDVYGAAPWTDATRTQQVADLTFPTNLGINVHFQARGFSFNAGNMNDYVICEVELTNTGEQDYNCDGVVERSNHKIEALSYQWVGGSIGIMGIKNTNARWSPGNDMGGSWPKFRTGAYDASPDPDGNPWAMPFETVTGVSMGSVDANGWAPDEVRKVGYRNTGKFYLDLWHGIQFLAVKSGKIADGSTAPDKKTIFDSPGVGEGVQRGWFASNHRTVRGTSKAESNFFVSTGSFYEEGGAGDPLTVPSIKPDPNWFDVTQAYTENDPVSFAAIVKPEADRGRPEGSSKYTDFWLQNWERNFPGTPAPGIPAEDTWSAGCTQKRLSDFSTDPTQGVGPFSLEVNETITIVLVEYAGHRITGARQSLKAARFAYENDYNVPSPPAMPIMMVKSVPDPVVKARPAVYWDAGAEASGDFAGYKVYKVSAYPDYSSLELGLRFYNSFDQQTAADIGATYTELSDRYAEPINPNNSLPADWDRLRYGTPFGPWRIIAYITPDQLVDYINPDANGYAYKMIDNGADIDFGKTYYYHVAAFDNETAEIAGVTVTGLQTGKGNWNGRTGRWMGNYPFTIANAAFPTSSTGRRDIGAPFVNLPSRLNADMLTSGEAKIEVKPNPYKVQAPHDVGNEHKIMFYNLTANTKITILDLSGMVIDVLEYAGYNPNEGSIFWEMFSKDGPEVQSGLYIWIAEYPGGQQTGYLAIMR